MCMQAWILKLVQNGWQYDVHGFTKRPGTTLVESIGHAMASVWLEDQAAGREMARNCYASIH